MVIETRRTSRGVAVGRLEVAVATAADGVDLNGADGRGISRGRAVARDGALVGLGTGRSGVRVGADGAVARARGRGAPAASPAMCGRAKAIGRTDKMQTTRQSEEESAVRRFSTGNVHVLV